MSHEDEWIPARAMKHNAEKALLPSAEVVETEESLAVHFPVGGYSPMAAGHFVTLHAASEAAFQEAFHKLDERLGWRHKHIPVIFAGISTLYQASLLRLLGPQAESTFYGPYSLHVVDQRPEDESGGWQKSLEELGMTLDKVREEEMTPIASLWGHSDILQRDDFIGWLARTFPSVALREKESGTLASWCFEYPIGAGAHQHTREEFRGRGLATLVNSLIVQRHFEHSELAQFNSVHVDNGVAQAFNRKLGRRLSDKRIFWLVWRP